MHLNPNIVIAIIGLFASVGGVYIANRYTARTARKAAETTERIEERKLEQSTWEAQYAGWKDDALKLRELRDKDQEKYEADKQRMEENRLRLEAKLDECSSKIDELNRSLNNIQSERAQERAYLDSIVSWCRVVVVLLRQAGIAYPPLPPGVVDQPPPNLT